MACRSLVQRLGTFTIKQACGCTTKHLGQGNQITPLENRESLMETPCSGCWERYYQERKELNDKHYQNKGESYAN